MENRRKISTFVCLFYWFRGMALNAWELAKTKTFFNNNLYLFLNSMENLGTIQFLVETVERLTKEGTTYKVELEHTKERVAALEEESAKKNVRISELEARVEELEKMLIAKGSTVTIHQNNGIVGEDVVAHDVAIGKEGGSDAGNS